MLSYFYSPQIGRRISLFLRHMPHMQHMISFRLVIYDKAVPFRRRCLFCEIPQICFFGWKFFEKYFKQIFGDTIFTFASFSLFSPLVRPQPAVKQFITSFLSSFESKQIGSSGLENFDSGLIYLINL